jgi:hypothetical protein
MLASVVARARFKPYLETKRKRMLACFLLALIALCTPASGSFSLSFSGNVTLKTPDPRFNYRHTTFNDLIQGLMIYTSIQATEETGSNSFSADANGIFGVAYYSPNNLLEDVFQLKIQPSLYICFFNVSTDISALSTSTTAYSADITGSLAFIGKVLSTLMEYDSSGNVVQTYDFNTFQWNTGTVQSSSSGLSYITITSSQTSSGGKSWSVAVTFAVSSVLGKLNQGSVTITPTSIESYFQVENYPYAAITNYLELALYVGYAAASKSVVANGNIVAGSGDAQVYIHFAETATVNGNIANVQVTGMADLVAPTSIPNSYLVSQLQAQSSLTVEARLVTVKFPANAASITYDPTIGFGAPNGISRLVPSFGLLVMLVALVKVFAF